MLIDKDHGFDDIYMNLDERGQRREVRLRIITELKRNATCVQKNLIPLILVMFNENTERKFSTRDRHHTSDTDQHNGQPDTCRNEPGLRPAGLVDSGRDHCGAMDGHCLVREVVVATLPGVVPGEATTHPELLVQHSLGDPANGRRRFHFDGFYGKRNL